MAFLIQRYRYFKLREKQWGGVNYPPNAWATWEEVIKINISVYEQEKGLIDTELLKQ